MTETLEPAKPRREHPFSWVHGWRTSGPVRSIVALVMGTGVAQVIPILFAPIMTRIYSPADYGGYALYTSLGSVIAVIATGQYHSAIMLPKDDEDAFDVLALSIALTVAVSAIALLVFGVFGDTIARLVGKPGLSHWLIFIPFGTLATGTLESVNSWTARTKAYNRLARSRVAQQVLTTGASIALGLSGASTLGIIASALAGQCFAAIFLLWKAAAVQPLLRRGIDRHRLTLMARRYRDFPTYSAPQSFLDNVSTSGIVVVLGRLFPLNALGLYSVSNRMIQLPVSLVSGAISTVFYQEAAARHSRLETTWPLARKLIVRSALIFIPSLTLLALLAPFIFRLAFGERWAGAGDIVRALTPWITVNTLTSPISTLPQILNRQRTFFHIGILYNLLQPTALAIGGVTTHSVAGAVWVLSCSASLFLLGVLVWFRRISKTDYRDAL